MNGKSGQHDDKLKVKEGQVDVLYMKQRLQKKPRKLNDKMWLMTSVKKSACSLKSDLDKSDFTFLNLIHLFSPE